MFDFGIIHQIPNWRDAVSEVRRVLTPGGRFSFEEVTAHALARPTYQRFLEHPTERSVHRRAVPSGTGPPQPGAAGLDHPHPGRFRSRCRRQPYPANGGT